MNVLLIKMNTAADEIIPPISLGYLASSLQKESDVLVVDCLKERKGLDGIKKIAQGFDLVGISLFTKDLAICRNYLSVLKESYPGIKSVLGGPHPSASPEETLEFFGSLCDYVLAGESEIGFTQLVKYLGKGSPPPELVEGLCFRNNGQILKNPVCLHENIDDFKVAWEQMPPNTYPEAPHGAFYRQFPTAPIITSRGCLFHCTFCGGHIVSGRKIRQRSVDNVIDEISLLCGKYNVREIHIEDDNFTFNKEYVMEFCKKVKKNFPDITWTCPNGVRIDTIDEEMLQAMIDSGCYSLTFGIESGNDDTLVSMKKGLSVEKITKKIQMIKSFNIEINGFFILGFPGETVKKINQTIKFACSLPLKRASFANFQPFPGTDDFKKIKENGLLNISYPEKFNPSLQSTIWSPLGISKRRLMWLRRKALLKFYLRPAIISSFIAEIKTKKHFFYIFKRALRWLTFSGTKT